MKITINQLIRVTLTDRGRQIWRYAFGPRAPVDTDGEGRTEMSLRLAMFTFGNYFTPGEEPPFEREFEIVEDERTCLPDGEQTHDDAALVEKILAAFTEANGDDRIGAEGYTIRDYIAEALLPALRKQGITLRIKPE